MSKKNASWLSEEFELIGGTIISRRSMQKAVAEFLDCTNTHARAAVWSMQAQNWPLPRGRINDGFAYVDSASAALEQIKLSRLESSRANARLPRQRRK